RKTSRLVFFLLPAYSASEKLSWLIAQAPLRLSTHEGIIGGLVQTFPNGLLPGLRQYGKYCAVLEVSTQSLPCAFPGNPRRSCVICDDNVDWPIDIARSLDEVHISLGGKGRQNAGLQQRLGNAGEHRNSSLGAELVHVLTPSQVPDGNCRHHSLAPMTRIDRLCDCVDPACEDVPDKKSLGGATEA
ncbi:MAG TPA: hypothetical protein VHC20_05290, partial [Candidatus Paceibacterota bacterium]|nr:hypothetical protein [Candidatus Paceibacterota bacterium]